MYHIIDDLKTVNLVRIYSNLLSETPEEFPVKLSKYRINDHKELEVKIDHVNSTATIKSKSEEDLRQLYQNGLWLFNNKKLILLQDYGDDNGNPVPEGNIELHKGLILGRNLRSTSLGIYNDEYCIVYPLANSLNIILLGAYITKPFNFSELNSKRPYYLQFLTSQSSFRNTTVDIFICIRNYHEFEVGSGTLYEEYIKPQRLNSLLKDYEFSYELKKEIYNLCDPDNSLEVQNGGFLRIEDFLEAGFSYDAKTEELRKDSITIYVSSLSYFYRDKERSDMDSLLWYVKDLKNLIKEYE